MTMRTMTAARPKAHELILLLAGAWLIPGGAHLWQGRWTKGLVFLITLPLMFVIGITLGGRLFPFEPSEPFVALAAMADLAVGLPYVLARAAGYGTGQVTVATFEYANTFLITAGLLNLLVMLDAYDLALGRRRSPSPQPSSTDRG